MEETKLRFKARELLERHNVSMYRVAQAGGLSYGTVHRVTTGENNSGMTLDTLRAYLVGLGFESAEVAEMRIGDVFDVG